MQSFKSVNEADRFRYDDCHIIKINNAGKNFDLQVEALIVKANNSQNTNYTESYADVSHISFKGACVESGIKEGMKRFDANDKLIEEIQDADLDNESLGILLKQLSGMYLNGIKRIEGTDEYVIFLELPNEDAYDTLPSDTFQIKLHCESFVVTWERYLNRVQQ